MPDYIVTNDCYVPVEHGTLFKRAGQRVTLATSEAAKLVGYVKSVSSFKSRKPKSLESVEVEYGGYVGDKTVPERNTEGVDDGGDQLPETS